MQGLIFDIKRFTIHDGPGIRTTVFFKGCPLTCVWCHNPESILPQPETINKQIEFDGKTIDRKEIIGRFYTKDELIQEILKDKLFYEESKGGVTFSGGEPLMQDAFLEETMLACRANGIHTTLDTSGYANETVFRKIASLADLILFDIKEIDETQHFHTTGVSNKIILHNLQWLATAGIQTILRVPAIPGYTFNEAYTKTLKKFLQSIKSDTVCEINILPYHAAATHKYMRCDYENKMNDTKTLDKKELVSMKTELEQAGWVVKIGG
ncbi:MAG: glycyl-radical enzyme activating protein [Bacteroidales bacterium]|nr:glycyl-radical enzyme activating protein [Bacteroidales bacterium]